MKLVFEFRRPRSPYWPAIRYHAQRQGRYKRHPEGVETIEWDESERWMAWSMHQQVKDWISVRMSVYKDGEWPFQKAPETPYVDWHGQ